MEPKLREELRVTILQRLDANGNRYGLPLDAITTLVRSRGFPQITSDQIEPEIRYLEDFGFVEEALKAISPENRAWRIHAKGRDFLASRNL